MSERKKFNATFRKRIADSGDKQFIHIQIGRAYENEDGHIDLIINSIPINWDGKVKLWKADPTNEQSAS